MDIWKHRTYIDMWSLVHLLSGALVAIGAHWIGFPFPAALVIALALFVAWEAYEWVLGILEVPQNVATDIIIGILGFLVAAYWLYALALPITLPASIALAVVTAGLSVWGFVDFLVRGYR